MLAGRPWARRPVMLVFAVIGGLTAWSYVSSRGELGRVARSHAVSDAYLEAVNAATLAEVYGLRLAHAPDADARTGFRDAVLAAFAAAERIDALGNDEDRRLLDQLEADFAPVVLQSFASLTTSTAARNSPSSSSAGLSPAN